MHQCIAWEINLRLWPERFSCSLLPRSSPITSITGRPELCDTRRSGCHATISCLALEFHDDGKLNKPDPAKHASQALPLNAGYIRTLSEVGGARRVPRPCRAGFYVRGRVSSKGQLSGDGRSCQVPFVPSIDVRGKKQMTVRGPFLARAGEEQPVVIRNVLDRTWQPVCTSLPSTVSSDRRCKLRPRLARRYGVALGPAKPTLACLEVLGHRPETDAPPEVGAYAVHSRSGRGPSDADGRCLKARSRGVSNYRGP